MRIDKRLNLVVPILGDEQPKLDGAGKPEKDEAGRPILFQPVIAYVHSVPISREVYERFFMVVAQTFSAIMNGGLGIAAGPSVAMLTLKRIAVEAKAWDGDDGVRVGLVEEIRRQTSVIAPSGTGWQPVPLQAAADRGIISADDLAEVENAIVFFIVASAVLNRAQRREMVEAAAGLWGARTSSLSSTEFLSSLGTSIATGSSAASSDAAAKPAGGPANAVVDGKPSSVPV